MCKRLEEHFQKYLKEGKVPEFFMKAKMILINKNGSRHPKIDKTRPINVLPAITKIFELSIRHYIETTMQDEKIFDDHQRGVRKQHSTLENI